MEYVKQLKKNVELEKHYDEEVSNLSKEVDCLKAKKEKKKKLGDLIKFEKIKKEILNLSINNGKILMLNMDFVKYVKTLLMFVHHLDLCFL